LDASWNWRVWYFENAGDPALISSADWMPRNLVRRVEVAFHPGSRDCLIIEDSAKYLDDQVKARELKPDGTYFRLQPRERGGLASAVISGRTQEGGEATRRIKPRSIKLIPIKRRRASVKDPRRRYRRHQRER
jgi:polyphosphate kinase